MGGTHTSVRHCLRAFSAPGFECRVIAFNAAVGEVSKEFPVEVVPSQWGPLGRKYHIPATRALSRFEKHVEESTVVFIHLLYRQHAAWGARMASKYNKPLVVVPHGGLDPFCFTYRSWQKHLWLRFYRSVLIDRGIFLFTTEKERDRAQSIVGPVKSLQMFWPCDINNYERTNGVSKDRWPERRLLFVGRLHPVKRVTETVAAFVSVGSNAATLTLVGPESPELGTSDIKLVAGEAIGRSVFCIPPCRGSELLNLYANSDALILFSHKENFGNVVAESLSAGKPVFVSDEVGLAPEVTAYGAGRAYKIRGGADIEHAIRDILSIPQIILSEMGEQARRLAKDCFSWTVFSGSIQNLAMSLSKAGTATNESVARSANMLLR